MLTVVPSGGAALDLAEDLEGICTKSGDLV